MIKVKAHRLAYSPVPKAACSSIKRALAELSPKVNLDKLPVTDPPYDVWHAVYPTRRFRPHRWETLPIGWFSFTAVRDPFRRLMACYTNRVVERRELRNSPKLRAGYLGLPVDPDPDFFFTHLAQYREAASVIKHHASHTWLFTGPKLDVYAEVYRVEALADLARDLSAWTETEVVLHRENTSSTRLSADDLAPATCAALRPWLAQEYAFLKTFYPDPPFDLH
ncbi:MAG: sulfotransferase family 2 domain-containing protein [Pseudomonadota bacterium]